MANWHYRLELTDAWAERKADNITIQQLATTIAARLEKVRLPEDYLDEAEELVTDFRSLAEDKSADADDFDNILERLYDLGDTEVEPLGQWPANKLMWIATF